jgi:hypothetical protein
MFKNYILVTLRNLLKNKVFILINVFGIGITIACCVTAYLNWEFSANWDKCHLNASNIYRVQFWYDFQGKKDRYGIAPLPLANYIKQNIKEVNSVVRYMISSSNMRIGNEVFNDRIAYADSAFFDLFTYQLKSGSFSSFHDKTKVLVSEEIAKKYYFNENAVGKSLTQLIVDKDGTRMLKQYEIGGVFKKLPANSSFRFDIITLFDNFWDVSSEKRLIEDDWKYWCHVLFLKIDDHNQINIVTNQLQQFVKPQNNARLDFKVSNYYLENFKGMTKRNQANPRLYNDYLEGGLIDAAVTVPAVMAALLLLLACFNFTNTSIAISSRRLKEIGVRKVLGGSRTQLIIQFLGENVILCLFGLLAGLLVAEWFVPAYDSMWPWIELDLNYTNNVSFIMFLFVLLFVTALIAGAYPAFYITSFEPINILKGKTKFGGTNWFTRILLGGQFAISLIAIIMGVSFYNNGKFQGNFDLGFVTRGVISVKIMNENDFDTYRNSLVPNKGIKIIAGSYHHIANDWINDPIKYDGLEREVDIF